MEYIHEAEEQCCQGLRGDDVDNWQCVAKHDRIDAQGHQWVGDEIGFKHTSIQSESTEKAPAHRFSHTIRNILTTLRNSR